jgi:hypothetical protein
VRWQIDPVEQECGLVTLLARLDEANRSFLDFHIVPNMDRRKRFHISLGDPWLKRGQPLTTLTAFCKIAVSVATMEEAGQRLNRTTPG